MIYTMACFQSQKEPLRYFYKCIFLKFCYPAVLQIKADQRSITGNLWPLTAHIYHVMIIVTGGFSKKSFYHYYFYFA